MAERSWFFYIVRCSDNSLYCGITLDVEERVRKHNRGTGAKYTAQRKPVALVYSEEHAGISAARAREAQIKGWSKSRKELLVKGLLH